MTMETTEDSAGLPTRHQDGAIQGWREWRLVRHRERGELALGSAYFPSVWEGPVLHAEGLLNERLNPWRQSGIYASACEHAQPIPCVLPVRGHVLLYGRVIAHQYGFRAEHALIRDLCVMYSPDAPPKSLPGLWYDVTPSAMIYHQGYAEEFTSALTRAQAEAVAERLARRYGCEVCCEEISYEQLKTSWTSATQSK